MKTGDEEMSDLIKREDAIEAVIAEGRNVHTSEYANAERIIYEADAVEALAMLPSAEANPTVIRCKALLNENDFKKIAERIKEENQNVIVIPCDAEVASAEAVHIHNDGTFERMVKHEYSSRTDSTLL